VKISKQISKKKKQKQLLSRSDINKDESVTTQSKHIRNQSVGFKFASEDSLFHVNTNEHSLNNSFEREFRFIKEDEYSTGDTTIKSVKINKNHLLKDIGNSIDIFVSEMNQYFTQEIVACQMEEIEKLMQQKSDEIMEINMSYLAKEFELKQKTEKEANQDEIKQLKEEKEIKLNKIKETYNELIKNAKLKQNPSSSSNANIKQSLIEEKFKLAMLSQINTASFQKNSKFIN